MIYQHITFNLFCDAFARFNRIDDFTYAALKLIFEYLENSDQDIELDVIAICCEYEEMSYIDIVEAYNIKLDIEEGQSLDDYINDNLEEAKEIIMRYLENNTTIIGESFWGFVFAAF